MNNPGAALAGCHDNPHSVQAFVLGRVYIAVSLAPRTCLYAEAGTADPYVQRDGAGPADVLLAGDSGKDKHCRNQDFMSEFVFHLQLLFTILQDNHRNNRRIRSIH